MASGFTGGAGGLFSGLAQGLQLLVALRNAEENQRIARERTDIDRSRENREQQAQDLEQANAPYINEQNNLFRRNVTAGLSDIRREYTPPAEADTYRGQITDRFTPGAFNAPGTTPQAPSPFPSSGLGQQSGPPSPVPNLNTSHIAQVLERATRRGDFDIRKSALDQALNAAEVKAQQTQLPVSEGLPSGFEAQPDKTFTPYQMEGRPDPLDNIFGPLLNNPINAKILQKVDPITYQQFEAWKARRIGGTGKANAGVSGKSVQDHIADILQEHPSWTDQQVADEVRRRMATP